MHVTIDDVANYFRYRFGQSGGVSLTPLKLQKLCYYAQAWSLVFLDRPLFPDRFEAWARGPLNPRLYAQYVAYGWDDVPPLEAEPRQGFTVEERDVLDQVWQLYGPLDEASLEQLVHEEDPWIAARHGLLDGAACHSIIRLESMKTFYTDVLHRGQEQA